MLVVIPQAQLGKKCQQGSKEHEHTHVGEAVALIERVVMDPPQKHGIQNQRQVAERHQAAKGPAKHGWVYCKGHDCSVAEGEEKCHAHALQVQDHERRVALVTVGRQDLYQLRYHQKHTCIVHHCHTLAYFVDDPAQKG